MDIQIVSKWLESTRSECSWTECNFQQQQHLPKQPMILRTCWTETHLASLWSSYINANVKMGHKIKFKKPYLYHEVFSNPVIIQNLKIATIFVLFVYLEHRFIFEHKVAVSFKGWQLHAFSP